VPAQASQWACAPSQQASAQLADLVRLPSEVRRTMQMVAQTAQVKELQAELAMVLPES